MAECARCPWDQIVPSEERTAMNAKTDTEHAAIETTLELACRASGGMRVLLLWDRAEDRISVVVDDARTGESFELPVHDRSQALDVFRHPFAHAGSPAWGLL